MVQSDDSRLAAYVWLKSFFSIVMLSSDEISNNDAALDVLEIDDPYWEEFDDVVDPVLGTESDSLDNLGEGTSSER